MNGDVDREASGEKMLAFMVGESLWGVFLISICPTALEVDKVQKFLTLTSTVFQKRNWFSATLSKLYQVKLQQILYSSEYNALRLDEF